LCTPQTYFFLNCIYDVKAVWQLLLFLLQSSRDFSDHEPPNSVVKRTAYQPVFIQFDELIFKRNHASYVYAHILDLLTRLRANVDKDVLQRRRLFLTGVAHVYRRPAEYTFHHTLIALNVDPL